MMARFTLLGALVAMLAGAGTARAGGLDRLGTAGAQELRIPVGAGAAAIGGATVAHADGLRNIYWNPASLATTDESEAMVSYTTYIGDTKVNHGAISTRLGSQGSVALSAKVLNIGDITVTTEDAPEGTGEILNPNFTVLGLTYARQVTDRVFFGITGSYISEKIAEATANGFALDLGVQYDMGWRGMRFGFAMKNVGPDMRFGGAEFEERLALPDADPASQPHVVRLQAASFELPSFVELGVTYDLRLSESSHATLFGAFQGNNFSTDEYRLGAEYRLSEWLALRGGFVGQLAIEEEDRQGDYLYNYSYGAGLNFKLGDRPVKFDWAGTSVNEFFDDIQQFSVGTTF